jgi:hypothetical protein
MDEMTEQEGNQRREGEDHDGVVDRHLRQGEQRVAVGQPAPDENHRRARCRCEQDEAGDVAVKLIGRQVVGKQMAHEQPAKEGHRKRLDQPIHEQRDADAAHVLLDFMQRAEIDLDQHRDDHHPDQQPDRQIDLRHLHAADGLEDAGANWPRAMPATMQRKTQIDR